MSFVSASIPVGATYAPTGGTARGLLLLTQSNSSSSWLIDDTTNYSLRKKINASIVEPSIKSDAPHGYTQRRCRVNIQVPVDINSDGIITTNTVTIELSADPLTAVANITSLRSLAMNLLNDTDFDALWQSNALG